MNKFYEISKNEVIIHLKITPNSKQNQILGLLEEGFFASLKISIAAVPEKNKANEELKRFLAAKLEINKTSIKILKGNTSSKKLVKISPITADIEYKLKILTDIILAKTSIQDTILP
jgi:uncharacterized protein (TIGR00251 family)